MPLKQVPRFTQASGALSSNLTRSSPISGGQIVEGKLKGKNVALHR
jgi:hypothetical protein